MPNAENRHAPCPRAGLSSPSLRLIVAMEDSGSVSAAAQTLNLSQPAASRIVAELEAAFRRQLCERLSRGVRLTPLARRCRRARSVLQQLAKAERELGDSATAGAARSRSARSAGPPST